MPRPAPTRDEPLTGTELEVLRLTGAGFRLAAIGREVHLHRCSATEYRAIICTKLGARNIVHAIPLAVVAGYSLWSEKVPPPPVARPLRYSEPEVVRLALSGFSAESIAAQLWLTPGTVRQVLLHAKGAMNVHSYGYGELAVRVLRHKVFTPAQLEPRPRMVG